MILYPSSLQPQSHKPSRKPVVQSTQFSLDKSVFPMGNKLVTQQLVLQELAKVLWWKQYDENLISVKAFPPPLRYLWVPVLASQFFFCLLKSKPPLSKHLPELGKAVGTFSWCYGRVWRGKEIWGLLISFWTFFSSPAPLWDRSWKNKPLALVKHFATHL